MLSRNIETFVGCDAGYGEAGIVIFGAPFDGTTSYRPGARFGSRHIRSESYGIETYSPYLDRDLTEMAVMDSGDIELSIGNAKTALDQIYQRAKTILSDGKLPFMLGGEHLVRRCPRSGQRRRSTRNLPSSTLTRTPTSGRIIWA